MGILLQVTDLTKKFKKLKAIDGLSFTVNEGDVYGFLGQNGAGKSTSMRMMLTLVKPSSGEINFFGHSVFTHRREVLKRVGAVIEKPDLYKYLSAYDNLKIFARLSGINTTRSMLMEHLHRVGLDARSGSKVKTFSQGMKQRLGIAVALVHDPKIVILDEPTNGLDPQGIADMRNLVLDLSRVHGKTVIVSSHLLSEIEQVANRMLIIHKGKKITEGVVSELLDPSHTVVEIETTDDAMARQLIAGYVNCKLLRQDTMLRAELKKEDIPAFVQWLSINVGVISVSSKNSLEAYFLSLTNPALHVDAVAN